MFPGIRVRTSGGGEILDSVPAEPAIIVSTPGAEPVADGGYGAALLLDSWALLGRPDLRAVQNALRWDRRRVLWSGPPSRVAGSSCPRIRTAVAQALIRWSPDLGRS